MHIKVLGAICVISGCGAFGFLITANQMRRIRLLQNLIAALDCMGSELQYRCTPLPKLCRVCGQQNQGKIQEIFLDFADELESQLAPDPERCMGYILAQKVNLDMLLKEIMTDFSRNIGKFDLDGQLLGIERTKVLCSEHLDALRLNKDQRFRSYQTLSLCAGAALAILFV